MVKLCLNSYLADHVVFSMEGIRPQMILYQTIV